MKPAQGCTRKHTAYQPTEAEWKCPECGAGPGYFAIDNDEIDEVDCPLLHSDDSIVCYGEGPGGRCPAEYGTTGAAFARALQKKHNLRPCPHCKGSGLVEVKS